MQEEASTSSRHEAEVSPTRYGGHDGVRESRIGAVVNGLRQHFLRQFLTSQIVRHMGVVIDVSFEGATSDALGGRGQAVPRVEGVGRLSEEMTWEPNTSLDGSA